MCLLYFFHSYQHYQIFLVTRIDELSLSYCGYTKFSTVIRYQSEEYLLFTFLFFLHYQYLYKYSDKEKFLNLARTTQYLKTNTINNSDVVLLTNYGCADGRKSFRI